MLVVAIHHGVDKPLPLFIRESARRCHLAGLNNYEGTRSRQQRSHGTTPLQDDFGPLGYAIRTTQGANAVMKDDNPFDKALKVRNPPEPFRGAMVDVTDTLQFAWDAARSVFEADATPEHAIEIARLMMEEAHRVRERQRSP